MNVNRGVGGGGSLDIGGYFVELLSKCLPDRTGWESKTLSWSRSTEPEPSRTLLASQLSEASDGTHGNSVRWSGPSPNGGAKGGRRKPSM